MNFRKIFGIFALVFGGTNVALFSRISLAEAPTQKRRLAALCAGPARVVRRMFDNSRKKSLNNNEELCRVDFADVNMKSVEDHCSELQRNNFSGDISVEFVSDVERGIKEVRGFLTCIVGSHAGAEQAYIKELLVSNIARNNPERTRCLSEKLTKLNAINDSTAIDKLHDEVTNCIAPSVEPKNAATSTPSPGWAIGTTVTGSGLLVLGGAFLVWGATAACNNHDAGGYCTDPEPTRNRVNQRRLTGYIVGGATATGGAVLLGVGLYKMFQAGSSQQAALLFGPGYLGVQGSF